ncbi:cask-interacting protein (caskin) 1,2 [Histomonas meleagridis]|uniref:cask-interacting protein (caskin) n=1 Tax=Histomonas meleagridis TaxID=135588 RepID=UPI003559F6AE|nr:cask-interacting protein (caskin) 1,2 [Histomonas meleagridis]KAH0796652.1 cask-interacting protein (caskin) [Histomonas meleagridis]
MLDLEKLQVLEKTIFRLNENNIAEVVQDVIKQLDENYPDTFNYCVCSLIYSLIISTNFKLLNTCIDFLIQLNQAEKDSNKQKRDIFEIFRNLTRAETQEYNYLLYELIKRHLIDESEAKTRMSLYFAQYRNDIEINILLKNNHQFRKEFRRKRYQVSKNDWELHKQLIEEGKNPSEILEIIRNDDIERLKTIYKEEGEDLYEILDQIRPSLYERCSYINNEYTTLIDFCAFYGSVQCFKFCLEIDGLSADVFKHAIAGGNSEIIRICEEELPEIKERNYYVYKKSYKDGLQTATQFHRNNLFFNSKKKIAKLNLNQLGETCIKYDNYEVLAFLLKKGLEISDNMILDSAKTGYLLMAFQQQNVELPNNILSYAVRFDNAEFCKYLMEKEKFDINVIIS